MPTRSVARRRRRFQLLLAASFVAWVGAGCNTVEYYELREFTDPTLTRQDDATLTHWYQKVYYSIEGAAGGIGTSAGGGCGCY